MLNKIVKKQGYSGFTLVELMVVMVIIGIIMALSTSAYQGAKASARDAKRKADLEDIRAALEIYRADCGKYPDAITAGGAIIGTETACSGNSYMSQVPQDPQNGTKSYRYEYKYDSTTKRYTLCSTQENSSATGFNCANDAVKNCGVAGACKYSVTSP